MRFVDGSLFFNTTVDLVTCRTKLLLGEGFGVTVFGPLLVTVVTMVTILYLLRVSCSACGRDNRCVDCLLAPTAIYLTIPLCRRVRLLGGGLGTMVVKVISNILTDLIDILVLTGLFDLDRRRCMALLPGSVAATVKVNISRRLKNVIAVAITIVVVANILKGVVTRAIVGLTHVRRPVTGNLTLKASTRTVNATGTVRLNRVRNTVDDLTVTITNLLAIMNTSIFTRFVWGVWRWGRVEKLS